MTRNREQEAAERKRAELRAKGKCELCEKPTEGTARCKACSKRVEGNTERYHGQGKRGPPERLAVDLVDLGHARAALEKSYRGFAAVATSGETNRRRRRELLIEPRSQAELAGRLVGEVLARNPTGVDHELPLPPIEPDAPRGYHERKAAGLCVRCGRPAKDDAQLCVKHQGDYLKRKRKSDKKLRAARRALGKCAGCKKRSASYYCTKCLPLTAHKTAHKAKSTTAVGTSKMELR